MVAATTVGLDLSTRCGKGNVNKPLHFLFVDILVCFSYNVSVKAETLLLLKLVVPACSPLDTAD